MLQRYEHKGLIWIDLETPSRQEVVSVMEEFGLTHFVAEELLMPTHKPRVEYHPKYLYVILHFPALRHTHKTVEQEVDFVVGRNFIVTTHYDTIDPLHKFSKLFEVNSVLDHSQLGDHAGFLFFYMMRRLYKSVDHELDYVKNDLSHIEDNIFNGHEVQMVRAISRAARDLLNLRQTIEPHRDVLKTLAMEKNELFGEDFLPYLKQLENEYYRLHNHIMRHTDSLHELRETNNSLLSTKENETMRVLTLMALLTFPLSLLVAIFGVQSEHNPLVGLPYDFWIIIGILAALGGSMLWYFRHKGWL